MATKDKLVNLEDLKVVGDQVNDLKSAFDDIAYVKQSVNEYDYTSNGRKEGYYLKYNLVEEANANCVISEKIPLVEGDVLRWIKNTYTSTQYGVIFNANDEKLIAIGGLTVTETSFYVGSSNVILCEVTAPANTAYVRINLTLAYDNNKNMVTINNAMPSVFVPYYKELLVIGNKVDYQANFQRNILADKSIVWFGDSLTDAVNLGWSVKIPLANGMTSTNYAKSGSTVSYRQNGETNALNCVSKAIETYASSCVGKDYIILSGGINDAFGGSLYTIGSLSDGYDGVIDPDVVSGTILGALENAVRLLLGACLGSKVGYILTYRMPTSTKQDQVFDAIKTLLIKYGIPCLDLRYCSGVCAGITAVDDAYFQNSDATHLTELGYEKYVNSKVEAWLRTL